MIRQAFPRFEAWQGRKPESPYARMVATSAHLHFAALGLEPAFVPDIESRLPSFDLDHVGPSWLAAVEMLVEAWLGAADFEAAERALDRMTARLESGHTSSLARATEDLLRARLLLGRGELSEAAAGAERALAQLGEGAPWWRTKAIRALEQAGAGSESLKRKARSIEEELGIGRA